MILLIKGQVRGYAKRDGTYVGPHFRSAIDFATAKHNGQFRKDGKTPYISHPVKVAHILRHHGNVTDPHTLASAVLHDTIEDTDTSYDELKDVFGTIVADVVREVTKDGNKTKSEQKRAEIDKADKFSQRAAQIKIADKIANMTDIILIPPPWDAETKRAYYDHAHKVVANMNDPHPLLNDMFSMVYREGRKRLGD